MKKVQNTLFAPSLSKRTGQKAGPSVLGDIAERLLLLVRRKTPTMDAADTQPGN